MLDSDWLAIKTKTPKSEPTVDAKFIEPSEEGCQQFTGHSQFFFGCRNNTQICSNPDPETAFDVMVKRRRAEVNVSTLSPEQKRELEKSKRQGTHHVCQVLCGRGGIALRSLAVCSDENALSCKL